MIPGSAQTPKINQRLADLFDDANILAKSGAMKRIDKMSDFLFYFLEQVLDDYDYIIIDTQPTRDSLLLTNAISAADYILIPMMCDANSRLSERSHCAMSCAMHRGAESKAWVFS